jgi:hypothetical protein
MSDTARDVGRQTYAIRCVNDRHHTVGAHLVNTDLVWGTTIETFDLANT